MADALHRFIEQELEKRGINPEDDRKNLLGREAFRIESGAGEQEHHRKTSKTTRNLCVGGFMFVLVVLLIYFLSKSGRPEPIKAQLGKDDKEPGAETEAAKQEGEAVDASAEPVAEPKADESPPPPEKPMTPKTAVEEGKEPIVPVPEKEQAPTTEEQNETTGVPGVEGNQPSDTTTPPDASSTPVKAGTHKSKSKTPEEPAPKTSGTATSSPATTQRAPGSPSNPTAPPPPTSTTKKTKKTKKPSGKSKTGLTKKENTKDPNSGGREEGGSGGDAPGDGNRRLLEKQKIAFKATPIV